MYEMYCYACGGKSLNGAPLPNSTYFFNEERFKTQANAWRSVANMILLEETDKTVCQNCKNELTGDQAESEDDE